MKCDFFFFSTLSSVHFMKMKLVMNEISPKFDPPGPLCGFNVMERIVLIFVVTVLA